jgi:hypothetical protein
MTRSEILSRKTFYNSGLRYELRCPGGEGKTGSVEARKRAPGDTVESTGGSL